MARRLNVVLLVVDSLRARSLAIGATDGAVARTPFLDALHTRALEFTRAYATECWTLPTHLSMFTGLLPSEHGAHFQSMAYRGRQPTIAELASAAGYHTEVITRNTIFDGTIPGATRGFRANTRVLAELRGINPLSVVLALSKPRFRRQVLTTGFFHPDQRKNVAFIAAFARGTLPADRLALARVLDCMQESRRRGVPYFVFCNLYDVHAPYPPVESSIFWPLLSWRGLREALLVPFVMPKLGGHAYLRRGFRMSAAGRAMLLRRYLDAIALMDDKLAGFYQAARSTGLLDDTLLVITSDHGQGFGEHGLYLHDASVFQTHLHVPLYVHHPSGTAGRVADVVSTRDLFDLFRAATTSGATEGTLLDARRRECLPIALAEHFYYPHVPDAQPQYRHNLAAAIIGNDKVVTRHDGVFRYDLARDPDETTPERTTLDEFVATCRRAGARPADVDPALTALRLLRAPPPAARRSKRAIGR